MHPVFPGGGAADVVIIGRSLGSSNSDGYNGNAIPVVSLTSYTVRTFGNRMGWHNSSTTTATLIVGAESTVTAAGASILGVGATGSLGGGQLLASGGTDILAAYWDAGAAPGNTTEAGVLTFGVPRLLFNIDNDPNAGTTGPMTLPTCHLWVFPRSAAPSTSRLRSLRCPSHRPPCLDWPHWASSAFFVAANRQRTLRNFQSVSPSRERRFLVSNEGGLGGGLLKGREDGCNFEGCWGVIFFFDTLKSGALLAGYEIFH